MKLIAAYDGSHCSEAALDDLTRAGLPPVGEALVVAVAEVWLPPPGTEVFDGDTSDLVEDIVNKHRAKGERFLNEADTMAKHAAARVRSILPGWSVKPYSTYGAAAWEILSAASEFHPDLIVLGSHGHSAIGRLILGSISQKVLTEAECSVRIARGRIEVDPSPVRIVIGFDGSSGANAAVRSVCSRKWPEGTEVELVAATDSVVPSANGRFFPPAANWVEKELRAEYNWIARLAEKPAALLTNAGLKVATHIREGNPNDVLVHEAENWHADCIFLGANAAGSALERFLLGSTSAAVASRAHCSVEIVRQAP
jgi:nucleotide-binding universal stress UspA family protein